MIRELLPRVQRKYVTYGFSEDADVRATHFDQQGYTSSFTVKRADHQDLVMRLNLPGTHNVLNALAAIAVATEDDIHDTDIACALANFQGIGRRFQYLGDFEINDKHFLLIDDYGHHPSEVAATLRAARQGWPDKRIVLIFQPHRFSRTRDLYEEFVDVLCEVDLLVLLDVYPAGEKPIVGADSRALALSLRQRGQKNLIFVSEPHKLNKILEKVIQDNDLVLTQGAGNVGQLAQKLSQTFPRRAYAHV